MNAILSALFRRKAPGPPRPLLVTICLGLIVAVTFTLGIEAFGHHYHDENGDHTDRPGSKCIVCRILDNPSTVTTPSAGLVSAPPPSSTAEVPAGTSVIPSRPAHATPFLRGPPAA